MREVDRVVARLMALPEIVAEPGFTARVLVPPGELYDPMFLREHDGEIWVNDDGGEQGDGGGQIVAVARDGTLRNVVELGRILPLTGIDIAPASFAPYAGQIFSVALPNVGQSGTWKNNVVQRIDLATDTVETFCTFPSTGTEGKGVPGDGCEGRFGPDGSDFAGRYFGIATRNYTIYEVTPDARCRPFVTFDRQAWGVPFSIRFSEDGRHLLVSTWNDESGGITRVLPDGTIEPEPLTRHADLKPSGTAVAPSAFGPYAGELFMSSFGRRERPEQLTHAPPATGSVCRLTAGGELKHVASGFRHPWGMQVVGDRLWVCDVNGDFIAGRRELPDGFIVEIGLDAPSDRSG